MLQTNGQDMFPKSTISYFPRLREISKNFRQNLTSKYAKYSMQLQKIMMGRALDILTIFPLHFYTQTTRMWLPSYRLTGFRSAVRLGYDRTYSSRRRHCFFYKHSSRGKLIEVFNDEEVEVSVSVLADPQRKFALSKKLGTFAFDVTTPRTFTHLEDFLFLETERVDIKMPSVVKKMPSISEELILIGYYRFHQPAWIFGDPTKRGLPTEWWHGMRWTMAPLCRIGPIDKACLSHFCQTDRGFSGSGMLARSAGNSVVYFGIHIGAMSVHDSNSCDFNTESTAGNMGIHFDLSVAARDLSQNSFEQ